MPMLNIRRLTVLKEEKWCRLLRIPLMLSLMPMQIWKKNGPSKLIIWLISVVRRQGFPGSKIVFVYL